MNHRIENVKQHLRNNKVTYVACSVTAVVCVAGTYFLVGKSALVNVRPIQILNWKSNQTVEVFIEALGDPGNIIQDVTTGTVYASQGQAARALGLTPSAISKHLNGLIPDVQGHIFEKLGKAIVADA